MSTTKGTEEINEPGAVETKVETVDYRSSAGHDQPEKVGVQVIHLTPKDQKSGGGVLARAAAAVADTFRSISGGGKSNTKE